MSLSTVQAKELISPSRLDVFSKIDLAEDRIFGYSSTWGQELYATYLNCTTPDGKFSEDGLKFTIVDYLNSFDSLLVSLKEQGFNPEMSVVGLGKQGIVNGAHRVAAAIALDIPLTWERTDQFDQIYDFGFLKKIALPRVFSDAILRKYLEHDARANCVVLTGFDPSRSAQLIKIASEAAEIIGVSEMELTAIGQRRLMQIAYGDQDWWQEKYFETMVLERFSANSKNSSAQIIFYRLGSTEGHRDLKEKLRSTLNTREFDRQIHGTDTSKEMHRLADMFLNSNARHFNNYAPIGAENRLISALAPLGIRDDPHFAIDGSSVLEVYGIRQARDIDIIADSRTYRQARKRLALHNDEYSHYPFSADSVIRDPRLHFVLHGYKFHSLAALSAVKTYVNDEKSKHDLKLVGKFYENTSATYAAGSAVGTRTIYRVQLSLSRMIEPVLARVPHRWQKPIRRMLSSLATTIFR